MAGTTKQWFFLLNSVYPIATHHEWMLSEGLSNELELPAWLWREAVKTGFRSGGRTAKGPAGGLTSHESSSRNFTVDAKVRGDRQLFQESNTSNGWWW